MNVTAEFLENRRQAYSNAQMKMRKTQEDFEKFVVGLRGNEPGMSNGEDLKQMKILREKAAIAEEEFTIIAARGLN